MSDSSVSRLSKKRLNQVLLSALGSAVTYVEDAEGNPLQIDVNIPYKVQLRIYIYNCTNPPGGRTLGEYKIQPMIKGHQNGDKCHFDFSENRIPSRTMTAKGESPANSTADGSLLTCR